MAKRKFSDLSWSDRFLFVFATVFYGAVFSALVWTAAWLVAFFVLNTANAILGIGSSMTGLALTMSVLLGYFPKYVSLVVGTDTDFQDIRSKFSKLPMRKVPWVRLTLSAGLVYYLVGHVMPGQLGSLRNEFDVIHLTEWFGNTWANINACIVLFLMQTIFSFPSNVDIPLGEEI